MADTKGFDRYSRNEIQAAVGRTRRYCVPFAVALLVALAAVPYTNAQSPQQGDAAPSECVTTFYKWVIGTMVRKRTPVNQKKLVAAYLSKSLYRWLYSQDAETRDLYFLGGNDWVESWIDEIEIVDSKVAPERAVVKVDLGKPEPPDNFVDQLRVNLRQENGEWRIDCIQTVESDEGDPSAYDSKYDPPGCKPVS